MPSGTAAAIVSPSATPEFKINPLGVASSAFYLPLPAAPSDEQHTQSISVIQFTPSGEARAGASPVDSIWIDFQRIKAKGVLDTDNIAALRINGLTGLTTLSRR